MPSPTQQLLSRTIYATDGTTTDWNFSFSGGYLDQAHVQAYTESPTGVRTDLTINVSQLIGPYQLRISPALAIGNILVIYRATPRDLPMVDFTDGSGLSETALDVTAKQSVFLAAEIADETGLAGVAAAAGYAQVAEQQAYLASVSAIDALAFKTDAEAAALSATASFDSFDDRYLGSKASNPTLDNDGNTLLVGAMYWNSVASELRFWSGSSWQTVNLSSTNYALKGANNDITSLGSLASINGGQLAGMRNRIINGDMRVAQRGAVTLVNGVFVYGGPDRFCSSVNSLTSGTIQQFVGGLPSGVSGYSHLVGCTTSGAGAVIHQTRLEAANVSDLTGKVVTITAKLFQDTGSTQIYNLSLLKPTTTIDVHSTQTTLQTSGGFSVPSSTLTTVTWTTSAISDASLGLAIAATVSLASAVSVKSFVITDVQLEEGSVATKFEQRPYGLELALCQRYYELGGNTKIRVVDNGTGVVIPVPFKVTKRAIPTITNSGVGTTTDINTQSFSKYMIAAGTVDTGYFVWEASAEL